MVDGDGFFDKPFPSDARLVDGHPDLSDFPGAGQYPLVDAYLATGAEIDGFGNNSPLYVRFAAPIDEALLPTPEDSLKKRSAVQLLDVDRDSPHRGDRIPITFEWTAEETAYQPGNLLAVAPVFGFPLRPGTTYALILREPFASPIPQRWGVGGDPGLLEVEETLIGLGVSTDDVSLAVPFTTQDPVAETRRIASMIQDTLGLPPLAQELTFVEERGLYNWYVGTVAVPVWQHGERPYMEEGGGLAFEEDGTPILAYWERVNFSLTIPNEDPPEGGWPVVLYSHGTGGDYTTFCNSGANEEEATVMAREGIAMFGISQPLHADRAPPGTNVELASFNYLNPEAARSNFRQGALDQVYLAEVLTAIQPVFTVDGTELRLDPDRVAYFGHSQGGLVGAIGAPFFSSRVRAAGFSGTGGGLAMTVVLRKDPLDIAAVLASLMGFDEGEELTTFHPIVGLIQMLSEPTDPLNYAPYWFAEEPEWDADPLPIVLTEGLEDEMTPSVTTEALAAAARVPIVGDPATAPLGLALRSLEPVALPSEGDAIDWTGAPITAGLGQYEGQGHYAIYDDRRARQLYRDLLVSALDGAARFED